MLIYKNNYVISIIKEKQISKENSPNRNTIMCFTMCYCNAQKRCLMYNNVCECFMLKKKIEVKMEV